VSKVLTSITTGSQVFTSTTLCGIVYFMSEAYRHIVLFGIKHEVDESTRAEAVSLLRELGHNAVGLREWTVTESIDTRKGHVIVENGLFESPDAFEEFRSSDSHVEAGAFMRDIADWLVADYLED